MEREKLLKLFNLARDIQEMGSGKEGFPFVSINSSNDPYTGCVRVEIHDNGYNEAGIYDGGYVFKNVGGISSRVYNACLQHLEETKAKAEGFFK